MSGIIAIVQHTPLWAFGVLALLVLFGVQALRPRTTALWRLLVVPAVFIGWGVVSLMARSAQSPALLFDWLGTGTIGFAIAWVSTSLAGLRVDRVAGLVQLPGSIVPLIRNLGIFLAKYFLAASAAVTPALATALAPWDIGISGLSSGFFAGWLIKFALKYRREPRLAPPLPVV